MRVPDRVRFFFLVIYKFLFALDDKIMYYIVKNNEEDFENRQRSWKHQERTFSNYDLDE